MIYSLYCIAETTVYAYIDQTLLTSRVAMDQIFPASLKTIPLNTPNFQVLTILEELDPMINLKMSANRPGSAVLDFWRHFFTRPKVPTRAVDDDS